ncbi:peptidoglycan DD-metalloendopeptidase family protein [Nitratifractor sp.]|uniref:murein hydrolase activator EnvC family protein n=1 Tax=Nitratifractor sp. TaxID=2268144 RepID=UPI0025E8951E|nr:peptidoglycan DD-metalloendopeptidase family protein [Nitratifractor sp.]
MRRFWWLLLVGVMGVHASKIVQKIQTSQQTLRSTEAQKAATSRQLSKLAASIKATEQALAQVQKKLDDLARKKKAGEAQYADTLTRIRGLDQQIAQLDQDIQTRHSRFLRLLSDQFATIVAMRQMNRRSERGVILEEYFKRYQAATDRKLRALKESIDRRRKSKQVMLLSRARLKRNIAKLDALRNLYKIKKETSQKLLKKLAAEEKLYRQKLRTIISRQNALRQTLAKLNILRKEEIEEAKRREAERKAELARRAKELEAMREQKRQEQEQARAEGRAVDYSAVSLPDEKNVKVKQYGSSYQRERVARYRGPRTIAPIRGARLVKRFGNYVDPIYKIKIFNDSVTLRAPQSDAPVRNVLNGKVVYVGENSILGKVVIVQHNDGLHTVYAGLSKISPIIRTGTRIRRGTAVGKVRRKLIFQATQHSKLINPMQLIRL